MMVNNKWEDNISCKKCRYRHPSTITCEKAYKLSVGYTDCRVIDRPSIEKAAETGGTKHDSDKPMMNLLDAYAMEHLAAVLTFGAKKYSANNWRKGISSSRLLAAALRHIFSYLGGEKLDSESNLSHLAHAMCCLMFAINLASRKPEFTDHLNEGQGTKSC